VPVILPAAILGSAAIGAIASNSAANKASKTASQTADKNNALQADIYGQNKAALEPFRTSGGAASAAINALLGLGTTDARAQQEAALATWRGATGYQDQFNQGQKAVTGALGNKGLLDSGAAQKALTKYGQSAANQSFGNYYSMLAGQQGVGLTAASAQAGIGQNYANAVSNNNNIASETVSNAALAKAGILNNFLSQGLSAYGNYAGMGSSYGAGK
jgi:hypothetical protein